MSRRRIGPPLIPGLWSLVVVMLLLAATVGYYHLLARLTTLARVEHKAE
ncbi:MAG: hypothetical protein LDL31_06690 [Prosthecobacter sp.]|jgi:hypothetical protein|nr:hypothetical protein [Prosthecobacter sp.]